ncbi:MAG: AAA family ATPase [Caldilineaceae bacterium]|nr:AAA family ATPase [Caldilineaceae bacterium]
MTRYVVIGTSGSGKTTLARQIAERLGIPHIELDALHWGPGWTGATAEVMRERVTAATSGPAWVLDGNYSKSRDVAWSRATHLIWLDYSFPLVFWRVFSRTLRRAILREELWNGNRESPRKIFRRDGILWWSISTYHRRRREYPTLIARPEYSHLTVLRFHTPGETERWLKNLRQIQSFPTEA